MYTINKRFYIKVADLMLKQPKLKDDLLSDKVESLEELSIISIDTEV